MFWSVKSTGLNVKDDNFKSVMGAPTRKCMFMLSRFWPLKGWGCGVGVYGEEVLSESVNKKEHSWKNLVSDSVEWSSKKLWKMTSADVKTDVKQ